MGKSYSSSSPKQRKHRGSEMLSFYSPGYPLSSCIPPQGKTIVAAAAAAAAALHCRHPLPELPSAMADTRRKSTADGKRPLAASSATEEEAVKRCDVCHGPLNTPVYQLGCVGVACDECGAGRRRSSAADLAEAAVDVVSRHLGYFTVPCPHEEYGCASSVASRDAAAHAAACAHAPCACPECAFLGSPAQLARHLTDPAGPHAWTATKLAYGEDLPLVVDMLEEPRQDKRLLVAEEDGGVFLLALGLGGHGQEPHFGRAGVVCVRGNADGGPSYSSSVVVEYRSGALSVSKTIGLPICSGPGEFDVDAPCFAVCQFSLHGEEIRQLHLRVRIDRHDQEEPRIYCFVRRTPTEY